MVSNDREVSPAIDAIIDRFYKAFAEEAILHISSEKAASDQSKSALIGARKKREEERARIRLQMKCLEQNLADLARADDADVKKLDELERESGKRMMECLKKANTKAMMSILQEQHVFELHATEAAAEAADTRTLQAHNDCHSGDDIYSATPIPDLAPTDGQPRPEAPTAPTESTPDSRSAHVINASSQENPSGKRPYREVRNHSLRQFAEQDNMTRAKKRNLGRTISFAEVYQDGQPQYKHTIVEHPKGSGEWYILRCDEHGYHFKENPLPAAAKHLNGQDHDFIPKSFDMAVQHIGFRVLGCNAEKATINNEMCRIAYAAHYQPPKPGSKKSRNATSSTAAAASGEGLSGTGPGHEEAGPEPETEPESEANANDHNSRATGKSPVGMDEPVVGSFYRFLYDRRWYASLVLPTGSLEPVGMAGSLAEIDDRPPPCYEYDKENKKIVGWAKGFEDNGTNRAKRKYPVMTFRKDMVIPLTGDFGYPTTGRALLSWALSKQLTPIDLENSADADKFKGLIGYDSACKLLARIKHQKQLHTITETSSGLGPYRNELLPAPAAARQDSASLQADIADLVAMLKESTSPKRDEVQQANAITTQNIDAAQSLHQQTNIGGNSTGTAPSNDPGTTSHSFASNAALAARAAMQLSFSLSLPSPSPVASPSAPHMGPATPR
ncbi:hypothetical protein B0T22DRAFT_457242 [Podospora appendiculata]|uniref:Uncharacterized protein n=1 Tax=Podospora appendiculata TaxID=314037 RepID=A0AAE1CBE8_9PEZI|nr:hypothetical protein B0T22DRAFT_457242 [Podospora appendiculata]